MTRMTPLLDRNEKFARDYTPAELAPPTSEATDGGGGYSTARGAREVQAPRTGLRIEQAKRQPDDATRRAAHVDPIIALRYE